MSICKKLLPALLFVLALLALSGVAWAESGGILSDTRIPDMAFRQALDARYGDANHYVDFLRTEINVSDSGISDLTGIELFSNLEELNCSGNNLEMLDLTQNTKLKELDCRNNPLATLNTGKLENLETLYCSGDRLTTLQLPTEKDKLRILNLSSSKIPVLDVQGYSALEGVTCIDGALTSLNAADCQSLDGVYCSGSPLSVLDVSQCANLSYISVDRCNLSSLSLDSMSDLVDLKCDHNPMTSLSVSVCPLLEAIDCSDCQLDSLSISSCGSLVQLLCPNNSLKSLDGIASLTELDCSNNRIAQLGAFPELIELNCTGNQLTGLNVPETLWTLDCSNNKLTSLDLAQCAELTYAVCSGNLLTELKLNGAAKLDTLYAHNNKLTRLDVEGSGFEEASWAGETEYEGFTVRTWNFALYFDPSVTLVRGGTVIYAGSSEPVDVDIPLPTFFVPYGMSTIEEDAFNGIAAEAVFIPETVTAIDGDPFADGHVRYIYGRAGSAAEAFARGKYTFVPVKDGE